MTKRENPNREEVFLTELANEIEREVDALLNENKVTIGFKRLSDDAILPTKAHPTDSGYDLYAAEDVIIEPGDTVIVPTGIAVELPPDYEAQIRPRSGVTAKTKLRVQLGTIDNGYTGEIGVIVDNIARYKAVNPAVAKLLINGEKDLGGSFIENTYRVRKGDRIAQLVIQRLPETVVVEIDDFSEDSDRGEGSFGSTGV